ncbi:MAG: ATP-binding cassette domain-containing protein [Firmicutes bacterium]|nr:ATP-binding cassette domain-containing protein [Bacillota bacterium]
MILDIKNVVKEYKLSRNNKFRALNGINLNFESGQLVSVIGESGSGKSTLMNVIGGLDNDYEGDILLDGKSVHNQSEKELDKYRKNKIGFVFQSFNLIPHLKVLDNITVAMTLSNVKKSERIKRAKKILKDVGLEDQMYKKPNQLSGGQKQRVAIARALINNPDIILADEPTGSLDSETSEQILGLIKIIANQGKLVIMVTHSEKVAEYSDRVITISDGIITKDEKKAEDKKMIVGKEKINNGKQNLSFKDAIGMALKNMKEKLARNLLVSIGASIGITSVIIMLSIGNGVGQYMTNTMNEYVNPNVVEVHQESDTDADDPSPGGIMTADAKPFEQVDIDQLSAISNVDKLELAYSKLSFRGNVAKIGEKESGFQTLSTISSNITSENISSGVLPKTGEVMISANLASELDENIVGKIIDVEFLIGETQFSESFKVSGIFGDIAQNGMNDFSTVFINYSDLTTLAKEKDVIIKPNTVYLVTDNQDNVKGIKDKVLSMGYTGSMEEKLLGMFTEMLDVVTYILAAIAAISLVVSAIMILVVMYISVVERTREIGVLKAIGARRKDIKRIFVAESFLIGLASGLFGLMVAVLLMFGINAITNNQFSVDLVVISSTYAIFGILVSVGISILAGLAPASKAAKLDPVESLRRE